METEHVLTGRPSRAYALSRFAEISLSFTAKTWVIVAVFGQWLFVAYLVLLYGHGLIHADWKILNAVMPQGYVPGQTAGNLAHVVHIALGALLTSSLTLQLLPWLRRHAPRVHRWNGRVFMVSVVLSTLTALYMTWFRSFTYGDVWQHLGVTLTALLILFCTAKAYTFARAHRFAEHRPWALRLFLVANGVWFFRIMLMAWILINHGPAGFDPKTFTGPALTIISFAETLVPLAVLELYLRAQRSPSILQRISVATLLMTLTLATVLGIFGATMGMWLPALKSIGLATAG
jgi:hypothetical protein